jgi:hydrogenase expression/formation protein HypC
MCLAVPAQVIELRGEEEALVELGGVRILVSLALVDDVALGDFVVVHVGYALARIDADAAARLLAELERLPETA